MVGPEATMRTRPIPLLAAGLAGAAGVVLFVQASVVGGAGPAATPLSGLFARAKGGFYHDGRFADYRAVVDHYDTHFHLGLSEPEKKDLVEYLKSL
jgi:phage-related minor tail protein